MGKEKKKKEEAASIGGTDFQIPFPWETNSFEFGFRAYSDDLTEKIQLYGVFHLKLSNPSPEIYTLCKHVHGLFHLFHFSILGNFFQNKGFCPTYNFHCSHNQPQKPILFVAISNKLEKQTEPPCHTINPIHLLSHCQPGNLRTF